MEFLTSTSRGAKATLAAGAAWFTVGALSLATPEPARYLDVLMFGPLALTIGATVAVHHLQKQQTGRLERIGFWSSVIGLCFLIVGQVGVIAEIDTLVLITVPAGFVFWVGGFALFGIATARGRVLPAWCGVLIALAEPLTVASAVLFAPISPPSNFGDYSGAVVQGAIWLGIGLVMQAISRAARERIAANSSVRAA